MMGRWIALSLVLGALRSVGGSEHFTELMSAKCGQQAHVTMAVGDVINFSSAYLLDENGNLPTDCTIEWRIELKTDALTNYGLRVTGALELEDSANTASCSSSQMMVTDKEDEDDNAAITMVECGTKAVQYVTFQDIAIVHLEVSARGAKGRGFNLRAEAVYVCGGEVTANGTASASLKTPRAPLPYPPDLFCLWSMKFPADHTATLNCQEFGLPRPKGRARTCTDYLRVQGQGQNRAYCGGQLKGQKKAVKLSGGWALLVFRSAGKQTAKPGFKCDVTFEAPK